MEISIVTSHASMGKMVHTVPFLVRWLFRNLVHYDNWLVVDRMIPRR